MVAVPHDSSWKTSFVTRRAELFDVSFAIGSGAEILGMMSHRFADDAPAPRVVIHCHVHALRLSRIHSEVADAFRSPDAVVLFEGIALKLSAMLLGFGIWPDLNGTDLVPRLLRMDHGRPLRIALIGGRAGVAERASRQLPGNWSACAIVDGFDGLADEDALLERLLLLAPDLILLGLGTPRQETTAVRWAARLPDSVIWCVGGLFDIISGDMPRAPAWLRRLRLEWLWRFLVNPKEHWPRLALGAPWLARELLRARYRLAFRSSKKGRLDEDAINPGAIGAGIGDRPRRSGSDAGASFPGPGRAAAVASDFDLCRCDRTCGQAAPHSAIFDPVRQRPVLDEMCALLVQRGLEGGKANPTRVDL
ncbi:WecB/TagA/CpsF family glycosyltransferase [Sphingomonas sp.]|uniref:WecB/TagA/CpsF family glycosyltransferase n=1 Tax=Sphingomonas sp. TaxID=28214 RepID=UPI002EDADDF2